MKHVVRQLKFVANDLDSGNICPACPTRDAKVYALHYILKYFPSLLFVRTRGGNHIFHGWFIWSSSKKKKSSTMFTWSSFLRGSLLNKAREVYTHMLKVREEQDPLSSSLTGEESSDTDNEDDEEYDSCFFTVIISRIIKHFD